jgi:RNA polymerase sigma factor (sigma-70 family)
MSTLTIREPARYELVTAGDWLESAALGRFVIRIAAQYRLGEDEVPDLLQETRIALWKSGTGTKVSAAWIVRVISNKAVDVVRRVRRARAFDRALAQAATAGSVDPDLEYLLHACVGELPRHLRDFYRLHYTEGWSEREIATRLGLCRSSVRWLDYRCRNQIFGHRKSSRLRKL